MREVRALLDKVKGIGDQFHVITGDLNTLAPGELLNMQKLPWRYRFLAFVLGGKIQYRAIKIMIDAGYIDVYRRLHTEHGFTFPAWDPNVRLDYVFTPAAFADRISKCDPDGKRCLPGAPEWSRCDLPQSDNGDLRRAGCERNQ